MMQGLDEDIPPVFRSPYISDITSKFATTEKAFTVDLDFDDTSKNEIVYLMVYDKKKLGYCRVDKKRWR